MLCCFVLFRRWALSVPYVGFPFPELEECSEAPQTQTHLGRPKSPTSSSVPAHWNRHSGQDAKQISCPRAAETSSEKEMFQTFPTLVTGAKVPASGFAEQLAPDLVVSPHLDMRWGFCSPSARNPKSRPGQGQTQAARPLGKEPSERPEETLQLLKLCKNSFTYMSLPNSGLNVQKFCCRKGPWTLKIIPIDFHVIINYKRLESTENLYREIKIKHKPCP